MNINYNMVPDVITGKDLDYLSDMFNWNYGAYKNMINAKDNVLDEEIKNTISKAADMLYNNMSVILNILNKEVENG